MARSQYHNGERRYHHGTIIWYDADKTDGLHWYVRLCISLQDSTNGGRPIQIHNVYFETIAAAKRYIDEF